jgi:hypothetical protein
MLGQMPLQLLERRALNDWFASATMDLGPERPLLAVLANKFSHHSAAHRETRRQNQVAALVVLVSVHNPLTQIHR